MRIYSMYLFHLSNRNQFKAMTPQLKYSYYNGKKMQRIKEYYVNQTLSIRKTDSIKVRVDGNDEDSQISSLAIALQKKVLYIEKIVESKKYEEALKKKVAHILAEDNKRNIEHEKNIMVSLQPLLKLLRPRIVDFSMDPPRAIIYDKHVNYLHSSVIFTSETQYSYAIVLNIIRAIFGGFKVKKNGIDIVAVEKLGNFLDILFKYEYNRKTLVSILDDQIFERINAGLRCDNGDRNYKGLGLEDERLESKLDKKHALALSDIIVYDEEGDDGNDGKFLLSHYTIDVNICKIILIFFRMQQMYIVHYRFYQNLYQRYSQM